ncbi:MAG: transposase [Nitrospirales bacterium]
MERSRRYFIKEFKVEAVRLLMESRCSVAQMAHDFGIRDTMLSRWKQELAVRERDVIGRSRLPPHRECFRGTGESDTSVGREIRKEAMAGQSRKRLLDPEDIAALPVFLASESANSISGQMLPTDKDI